MVNNCLECDKEIYAGELWCGDCIKDIFFVTDEQIEEEENASKKYDN